VEDGEGSSPMLLACRYGHLCLAEWLAKLGYDCAGEFCEDKHENSPMLWACRNGHASVCKWIHKQENTFNDIDQPNKYGERPLMWACVNGHVEICKWLILYGVLSSDRSWEDGVSSVRRDLVGAWPGVTYLLKEHPDLEAAEVEDIRRLLLDWAEDATSNHYSYYHRTSERMGGLFIIDGFELDTPDAYEFKLGRGSTNEWHIKNCRDFAMNMKSAGFAWDPGTDLEELKPSWIRPEDVTKLLQKLECLESPGSLPNLVGLINDNLEQLANEARGLNNLGRELTLKAASVQSAAFLVLPAELVKLATSEALKALSKYEAMHSTLQMWSQEQKVETARRSGLVFPVDRVENFLAKRKCGLRVDFSSAVYVTGLLEYLCYATHRMDLAQKEAFRSGHPVVDPPQPPLPAPLPEGSTVMLYGLKAKVELNGATGYVSVALDYASGRCGIRLDVKDIAKGVNTKIKDNMKRVVHVKAENLLFIK